MLDEEYVKKIFAEGWFESWEPEHDKWGASIKSFFVQQRLDAVKLTKPKGKMVLDVGTGKGRLAISFALAGASKVIGIDISRAMLAIANKRARRAGVTNGVIFEQGNAECLECAGESFDIVCCMETFVHLPNPLKAMKELTRVCKIGGIVIANATNNDPLWKQCYPAPSKPAIIRAIYRSLRPFYYRKHAGILRLIGHALFNIPPHEALKPYYRHYSRAEFLKLFTDASLRIEKVLEYGTPVPVFFLVLARKDPPLGNRGQHPIGAPYEV